MIATDRKLRTEPWDTISIRTWSFSERMKLNHLAEGSEEYHRDMEPCHDEEIEDAVFENRLHQQGHA